MTPAQLAKNSTVRVTPGAFGANCKLANGTDADHDINIGVGSCGDSTGTYQMTLLSTLVKQIDAGWAQGSAAGGLFSGSVATGTWYHVFVIRNDTTGAIDGGFDTSATAANRPSGWTAYCRVGAVLTDGSSNILAFFQIEDTFLYAATIFDVNAASVGTSVVPLTLSTPLGIVTAVIIAPAIVKAAELPTATWASPAYTDFVTYYNHTSIVAGFVTLPKMFGSNVFSNTSSQISVRSSSVASSAYVFTYGWNDPRGKVAA